MLAAGVADGFSLKTGAFVDFFGEEEAEDAFGKQGLGDDRVKKGWK